VIIEGDMYVDGGVSNAIDIAAAEELGATRIIAIDPRATLPAKNPANIVEVVTRSLEILAEARSACATEPVAPMPMWSTYARVSAPVRPGASRESRTCWPSRIASLATCSTTVGMAAI
jgi:predicted acylesterase/phospholipase RssA